MLGAGANGLAAAVPPWSWWILAPILRASSWADSDETAKGEWQQFTLTDTLRFSTQPASRLQLGMLGAGECLLDQLRSSMPPGP